MITHHIVCRCDGCGKEDNHTYSQDILSPLRYAAIPEGWLVIYFNDIQHSGHNRLLCDDCKEKLTFENFPATVRLQL